MPSSELEREQNYVGSLYSRLDELREDAEKQLIDVRRANLGGTHQNRSERDAFARIFEDRITQLREIDERLAFGRLELEPQSDRGADSDSSANADPVFRYIGRIGLRDPDHQPLLLDWRVPQARPFYQATAATPLGARARRHLQSRGRQIVRIDDEIFDPALLTREVSGLQGEAALMASLTAERTGRMGDIVATIQAEQDAIIRSELGGALVVQGGPGTGKTAVALHRAAYLLYSYRDRLASSGVLIVGPSRSFLQYIEAVLPSLGETGVVLASVGQLYPGVDATIEDAGPVAALKGSAEMAGLVARAVRSRRVVPTQAQVLDINGEQLTVEPHLIEAAMRRAWETGKAHNVARVTFNKAAVSAIAGALAEQLRSHGNTIEESDRAWLREDVRTAYDVKVALNTAWLPLTPQKLLQDLYARPSWLASLTPTWSPERRALLARERDAPFTVSDVALLDEAAELLGEVDAAADYDRRDRKQQRKRDLENARAAIQNMGVEGLVDARTLAEGFEAGTEQGTTAELAAGDRTWTYGHVVVDEAQELSAMQWRLLVRRNPLKSFTIVGDIAQASAAAAATSWEEALTGAIGSSWRLEQLTVNYRTPAQISAVAESMAEAHGVRITRSRAVREGEWPVEFVRADVHADAGGLDPGGHRAAIASVRAILAADDRGTVAVIATAAVLETLWPAIEQELGSSAGRGAAGLSRPVAVLTPPESKGLEFDSVVVVDPQGIIDGSDRGAATLYVAMTRPTQRLHLVSMGPLPAGIQPIH